MAVFHFCFDLSYFKLIEQNFYRDPFWTVQRAMIVTLFVFVAGLSQASRIEVQVRRNGQSQTLTVDIPR